ncbi:aldose 1-epimerase family protein yeaD [Vibrio ishigakensis]|uniref:Putative glucose-6-phosphate 1-epimerase n=1 Tax=Vibrio ishigakensis TaxID=1481914 RepID=A0A0B8PHP1_9VIBR|nr:aldose 1-epimerase family protein yeaD [Vibrio ishigakensis]
MSALIKIQSGSYQIDIKDKVEILKVSHPKADCEISLFGGQLLSFKPSSGREVFWLSELAKFDGNSAIRGGVPICWPWFGNRGKPSHGFARNSIWTLSRLESVESHAYVELVLTDTKETQTLFPYRFELRLKVTIAETLELKLEVTNLDVKAFEFTGALHSYFAVEDIHKERLHGLDEQCLDSVEQGGTIKVEAPFKLDKALDYVFENSPCTLGSAGLAIESGSADSLVVWNPWQEGASKMTDMHDSDYNKMLCIEPAVFSQPIQLDSNQSFTLDLNVRSLVSGS